MTFFSAKFCGPNTPKVSINQQKNDEYKSEKSNLYNTTAGTSVTRISGAPMVIKEQILKLPIKTAHFNKATESQAENGQSPCSLLLVLKKKLQRNCC